LNLQDRRILNRLQEDIPFISRPWEALASQLRIKEGLFLKRITFLKKKGIIRRISAVISARKINYSSTLVAIRAKASDIAKVARKINAYPEVTHNYKRGAEYNLWFTLVAKNKSRIWQIIKELKQDQGIEKIAEFPAVKLFKIDVKFPV
jgi:siroheme decarboxylase